MTANEMFEKLGYRIHTHNEVYIDYIDNKGKFISFEIEHKLYYVSDYKSDMTENIYIEEHQAIHQQMKELGWIE